MRISIIVKYIVSIIILLISILILYSEGQTKNKKNKYYIIEDTFYIDDSLDQELLIQYLITDTSGVNIRKIIDTIFTTSSIKYFNENYYYSINCSSDTCYLIIYNLELNLFIDTIYKWYDHNRHNMLSSGVDYSFNLYDSILTFVEYSLFEKKEGTSPITIIAKILSNNKLDTLRIIPNSEYVEFSLDYNQLFSRSWSYYNDDSTKHKLIKIKLYDFRVDEILNPFNNNNFEYLFPKRLSTESPLYYWKLDNLSKKWNVWCSDDLINEKQVSVMTDNEFLDSYTITADSTLVYWVKYVINGDTIVERREQSIFE